jgi:hypothetical protein
LIRFARAQTQNFASFSVAPATDLTITPFSKVVTCIDYLGIAFALLVYLVPSLILSLYPANLLAKLQCENEYAWF